MAKNELSLPQRTDGSHDAILDAASSLFAQYGFNKTTADAIAESAGVSKPTLYRRFSSKAEMLLAIRKRRYEGLLEKSSEITARNNRPIVTLRELFDNHLRYAIMNRQDFITLLTEQKHMGMAQDQALADRYVACLHGLLQDAVRDGDIRADLDHQIFSRAFVALANWPVLWFTENKGAISVEMLCDQSWSILINGAGGGGGRS